jgi:hypothetical protein
MSAGVNNDMRLSQTIRTEDATAEAFFHSQRWRRRSHSPRPRSPTHGSRRVIHPAAFPDAPLEHTMRILLHSSHSLELVHRMRAALNEVMTKVPTEQATPEVKAYLAEIILKAAAGGQTDYKVLLAAASAQIQTVLSQLMPPASVPPTRS